MKIYLTVVIAVFFSTPLFAQEYVIEQLENSPRHQEWVEVEYDGRTVHSFVVYPESSSSTPAVIVIHENMGLNDWARSFADQVAAAGYLAIAPDLLSEVNPDYERTSDYPSGDAARDALYQLDENQIIADLNAVRDYIANVPSSNGQTVVIGFCWGGSQSFRYATLSDDIEAAFVFYGSPPDDRDAFESISVPVYGFYGENDERINSTIRATEDVMDELEKNYEYEIYDGAGHGFMRSGDSPEGSESNIQARNDAWERLKDYLEAL